MTCLPVTLGRRLIKRRESAEPHKLQGLCWFTLNLQAQLNGFPDSRYQLVEGFGLCVAAA
jgi:hypothetical protein